MKKRFVSVASIVLALATTLTACGNSAQHSEADQNIVTYLEPNTFTTLYPPSAGYYPNGGVLNQTTDRLLYQDPETLELSPWIATSLPEVNADATEYTFDIRTDVTYSDGSKMTAENIVKNFDLYGKGDKDRKLTKSEQITNYDRGEVIDEDTVKFYFTAPAPGFAQATSSYNAGLLSDATLDQAVEGFAPGKATEIIGSGPFVVTEEKVGSELFMEAREDYDWAPTSSEHQGRAYIDGIRYILAAEDSVRIGGLISGQADISRQVEAPEEKHLLEQGLDISASSTNGMNNQLILRPTAPRLEDIRVRQAIIHGVDRDEIINTLFSASYPKATGVMAKTAQGYLDTSAAYTYDPEKAQNLLDEAGWVPGEDGIRTKDGERLTFNINEALPQPRSREVITKVQEQLKRIGIEITLNPGDNAAQDADSKDVNKVQIRHTMVGRADYDVIKSLYHSENRDVLAAVIDENTGEVFDPELEALLEKVASSARAADRQKASEQVQQILVDKAYILPLFEEPQVYGIQPYIEGFAEEAIGRPYFYNVKINKEVLEGKQ